MSSNQTSEVNQKIQESELPIEAKQTGIILNTLGASPDTIISGMMGALNAKATIEAGKTPIAEQTANYTETEAAIVAMFQENTGADICDSGGAYGRAFQRNRAIANFNDLPVVKVRADKKYGLELSISLYHYLVSNLELNDKAKELQAEYEQLKKDNPDEYELCCMELMCERYHPIGKVDNTYNYESVLDGTLQYGVFSLDDDEEECFVILQIHGGCDVRGGYTDAKIFHIIGDEVFSLVSSQTDLNVSCDCGYCDAYSDDAGYNWYPNGKHDKRMRDAKDRYKITKDGKVICKHCGKEVSFSANLDY